MFYFQSVLGQLGIPPCLVSDCSVLHKYTNLPASLIVKAKANCKQPMPLMHVKMWFGKFHLLNRLKGEAVKYCFAILTRSKGTKRKKKKKKKKNRRVKTYKEEGQWKTGKGLKCLYSKHLHKIIYNLNIIMVQFYYIIGSYLAKCTDIFDKISIRRFVPLQIRFFKLLMGHFQMSFSLRNGLFIIQATAWIS